LKILYCALIGYLLGSLSPSAFLSKLKKKNFRENGTGNLGATNTLLILGKGYAAFVMLFDIAKAYLAVKISQILLPHMAIAGALSGFAAVLGHIFPFYMKFKGGKGLASFGGMILGLDPIMFLILLVISLSLMLIVNYSYAMPISASILFPVMYAAKTNDPMSALVTILTGILIIYKHYSNFQKAKRGEDVKIREYIKHNML